MVSVLTLVQERMKLLSEFNDLTDYYFGEPAIDSKELLEFVDGNESRKNEILKSFLVLFENTAVEKWTKFSLDASCHELISSKEYKPKEAFMTLRVALTGKKATPQIFDMLPVLGKDIVVARIKKQISN